MHTKPDWRELSPSVTKGPYAANTLALPIAAIVFLALLMSASGAYGTRSLGLEHTTALWLVVAGLLVGQAWAFDSWLPAKISDSCGDGAKITLSAVATLCALTVELHALKFTPLLPKAPDPLPEFLVFLSPMVLPVAVCLLVLRRLLIPTHPSCRTGSSQIEPETSNGPGDDEFRVIDSWPAGEIARVSVYGHYLEVTTDAGTSLIRGRMRDALRLLRNESGLQIHRSHWVADRVVVSGLRKGRDYKLAIQDGSLLPVARSYVKAVRARGWIRPG